jgi:iron complex outermembrane receptor protein
MKSIGIFLALLISVFAYGNAADPQTGTIKGKVITRDQLHAVGVVVKIIALNKTTLTDEEGIFIFSKVAAGVYTIEFSLLGYTPVTEKVTIIGGKETIVTIPLALTVRQLEEVMVKNGLRFANLQSAMVARMPLKNLENPQVYSVVPAALLKEQIVTSFDDALKNAPGINRLWSSTGRGNDGGSYYSLRGFSLQARVVNGVAGASNGSHDPANMERIEVIKGPSGTLFGSSLVSFGGLINTVTKRPQVIPRGELSITGGSYGLTRLTADINTPLDSAGRLLLRINAAYHYENSWQDAGFKKSIFLAPALTYKVSPRLTFNLQAGIYSAEATNAEMLFLTRTATLKVTRPQDMRIDFSRSFTSNDITIKTPVMNLEVEAKYQLGKNWVSQTLLSRSNRKSDGYYSYLSILPGDSSLSRLISNQNSYSILTDLQHNFIGDFLIGGKRNRVVIGVDFLSSQLNNASSAYISFDTVQYIRNDVKYIHLTKAAVDARLNGGIPAKTNAVTNSYSMYASDVLDLTKQLHIMASLRVDRFDNRGIYNQRANLTTGAYAQTAFSPKLGITYELIPRRMSLFTNYMNGFQNLAPVTQADGTVSIFKPQQANQWEAGIKTEMLGGKITGTVTYYDIYVSNVTRPHPTLTGFTVQDGNISSKGFEADLVAALFADCNIVAGYSYNHAVNDQTDKNINGLRPVSSGPKHLANIWLSYKAGKGKLKGLGIGFGGNYASENSITNSLVTGQFILPSYTVMNATVFFDQPAFRIGVKLDNLTNQQYWSGWTTVEPQMPRRFALNLAVKW